MADVIEEYQFGDVDWLLTYRDSNGNPIDLTGWTLSIGSKSAFEVFQPAVVFVDAAAGQIRFTVPWDDAMPINHALETRIQATRGQEKDGLPPISVKYV